MPQPHAPCPLITDIRSITIFQAVVRKGVRGQAPPKIDGHKIPYL